MLQCKLWWAYLFTAVGLLIMQFSLHFDLVKIVFWTWKSIMAEVEKSRQLPIFRVDQILTQVDETGWVWLQNDCFS